ncbi:MAG: LptF/LptG family permease [Candidatus Omnitrophica bacterium]|nr:LptF/LptG family permease [Candidatus Omnitrophota bacterium]MDD5487549.1 LptF/LptG family permease [Candidatus Omnitrophota bacterium]
MRIIEKYIIKSFLSAFMFCILLLIILGIIGDILGFIDDIFKHNIPLGSILAFYFYLAPFAFVNMVPFAALLSSVYVFNTLSKNHEVTAVITSGISLWRMVRPVVAVTFVVCIATFIVNDRFVPSNMQKANIIRKEELESSDAKREKNKIENIAVYGRGDQIIYAEAFYPASKMFNNVIIHRQDNDQNITEKISARVVRWRSEGYWLGEDVVSFEVGPDGNFIGNPRVQKIRKLPIEESPKDFVVNQWDPRFMGYAKLKSYIKAFTHKGSLTLRRLRVDLNYKLSFPFMAMITVLVGVPFSIDTGRSSALIGMARGIAVAMLSLPLMAVSLALGKGGALSPPVAAWASNIIFALFGIYMINKRS